eukprot:COSAG04_NODE_29004_length_272_cov_0.583815_1_plen_57_part_01
MVLSLKPCFKPHSADHHIPFMRITPHLADCRADLHIPHALHSADLHIPHASHSADLH